MLMGIAASSAQGVSGEYYELPTTFPANIKHLFELKWCKKCKFDCLTCERVDGTIHCSETSNICQTKFDKYECINYEIPQTCLAWYDGCNYCRRRQGGRIRAVACLSHPDQLFGVPVQLPTATSVFGTMASRMEDPEYCWVINTFLPPARRTRFNRNLNIRPSETDAGRSRKSPPSPSRPKSTATLISDSR